MPNFQALTVDSNFECLGNPCTITSPVDGSTQVITVIDSNDGVSFGDISVSTTRPALCVRQSELAALGFHSDALIGEPCEYLGTIYKIRDAIPNPVPGVGRDALVHFVIVEP